MAGPGAEAELIWDLLAELAEGPVWSARDNAVWFVDIKGRRLPRYGLGDGVKSSWDAPDQVAEVETQPGECDGVP